MGFGAGSNATWRFSRGNWEATLRQRVLASLDGSRAKLTKGKATMSPFISRGTMSPLNEESVVVRFREQRNASYKPIASI